jgi:KipI family sensor histidine kinase inhibitor
MKIMAKTSSTNDHSQKTPAPMPRTAMLGEGCMLWRFGDGISPEISTRVLNVYRKLQKQISNSPAVFDIVPAYDSLAIHFNPLEISPAELQNFVSEVNIKRTDDIEISQFELPTIYNGEDLQLVAAHAGIALEKVIELHSQAEYTVAMIGFTPHFPYLIGLDPRLETPRLDSPRISIPAGSVAIGGAQTGVYPVESPGGWNLIGSTDPQILQYLRPGDIVRFVKVEQL